MRPLAEENLYQQEMVVIYMDDNPDNRRYIGIDIGDSSSCICSTKFDTGQHQYAKPTIVQFAKEEEVYIPSVLWLDSTGTRALASGSSVYKQSEIEELPERISSQFKSRTLTDKTAAHHLQILAGEFYRKLLDALHVKTLSAEEVVTTIGLPVDWNENQSAKDFLLSSFQHAGFNNTNICLEPAAVVLYAAFLHHIPLNDGTARWLVVDIGDQKTRFSLMETIKDGSAPILLDWSQEQYGGCDFDEAFLTRYFIPKHLNNKQPSPKQMANLLLDLRKFKEDFSRKINRGDKFVKGFIRVGKEEIDIALTPPDFIEGFGKELIDRFKTILQDNLNNKVAYYNADYLVLCGGSANWQFIQEAAASLIDRDNMLSLQDCKMAVAQGLALSPTGLIISPLPEKPRDPQPPEPPAPPPSYSTPVISQQELRNSLKKKARKQVLIYAAIGTAFTLVVSLILMLIFPIPGFTTVFLLMLEVFMLWKLTVHYSLDLSKGEMLIGIAGLGIMSFILKFLVGDLLGMIPIIGPVIKTFVAGVVIYALGELAILICDKRRFDPRFSLRK